MATDLYIICNIETSKEKVLEKKDWYLKQLKALNFEPFLYPVINQETNKEEWVKAIGEWEYEFPTIYDEKTNSNLPDDESKEIIYFSSPTIFNISVYESCLILSTIYKYRFLYSEYELDSDSYLWEFRKNVFDIISIFKATEIIYLADNGCDKLSTCLELKAWEGVSYHQIKEEMIKTEIPFQIIIN